MTNISLWQLIVLLLLYTAFISGALYYGVILGYSIGKKKKMEVSKFVTPLEFIPPVELQPKSIFEPTEDENQFFK